MKNKNVSAGNGSGTNTKECHKLVIDLLEHALNDY